MTQEDIDFLRDLQHELNTQDPEANAEPVVWGIMEVENQIVPIDCGDETVAVNDISCYTLSELIEYAEVNFLADTTDDVMLSEWKHVDTKDISAIVDFLNDNYNTEFRLCDIDHQDHIARGTGAFLTKRAAQEYIDKYGYNHSNPRAWSMCAYRNFELEHLLNIIKTMDMDRLYTQLLPDVIVSLPVAAPLGSNEMVLDKAAIERLRKQISCEDVMKNYMMDDPLKEN